MLIVIVPNLFTHCGHLQISGSQDFSRVPEIIENRFLAITVTIFYNAITGWTSPCLTDNGGVTLRGRCVVCSVSGGVTVGAGR